ncbi:MAG TPA: hypothetical protein VFL14_07020 [Xanthomonadales bacterium]|nr:hypothetical protein [Xanthomonadales bacterium]
MRLALSACPALALLVSSVAFAGGPVSERGATLSFVSPEAALIGNAYGINAVDSEARVLDERIDTFVASGLRTVWYACPGEAGPVDGSRMSFEFEPGKHYELVCRAGLEATIRESEDC